MGDKKSKEVVKAEPAREISLLRRWRRDSKISSGGFFDVRALVAAEDEISSGGDIAGDGHLEDGNDVVVKAEMRV